ncbi:MAG: tail fiber protein [Desulfovibrio sp.]|nr:tail fiber protein [Desulfovibrio sp.]MBI4960425.1 tail fiber protein [Desulfovibrio sp.]
MHRIDGPGAVSNLFTEGDPSVPQMATVVSAAWLNDVQENLARAIEAAGITPVKADYDQLRRAITLLSGSGEIGEVKLWPSEILPTSGDWMECDGSALPIVDYPALYAAIGGSAFGSALSGYFRLPNVRGRVVRGWDHGAGVDPDAALRNGGDHVGSTQEDAIRKHNHPTGSNTGKADGGASVVDPGTWNSANALIYNAYTQDFNVTTGKTATEMNNVPKALETRMKNIAFMFIIRWR